MKQATPSDTIRPPWLGMLRSGTGTVLLSSFWEGRADHALLYGPSWLETVSPVPYSIFCLMLIGWLCPRVVAAALLLLHHQLFLTQGEFAYGFDYLCASALFFCAVIPSRPATHLPLRMVQVWLCTVYAAAGLAKVLGPTWWTGEALWKAATLPGFEGPLSPLVHQLSASTLLWQVLGWLVMTIEVAYPLSMWLRWTKTVWLGLVVALHIGIALVMGLYAFSAVMVVLNLAAFYDHIPFRYRMLFTRLAEHQAEPSRRPKDPLSASDV